MYGTIDGQRCTTSSIEDRVTYELEIMLVAAFLGESDLFESIGCICGIKNPNSMDSMAGVLLRWPYI